MAHKPPTPITVRVIFKNPMYNYERELMSYVSYKDACKYYIGSRVNVASWPDENFQLVESLELVTKEPVKVKGLISHEEYLKLCNKKP